MGSDPKGKDSSRTAYLSDGHSRSHLINVHIVVIHDEGCSTAQARSRPSKHESCIHVRSYQVSLEAMVVGWDEEFSRTCRYFSYRVRLKIPVCRTREYPSR